MKIVQPGGEKSTENISIDKSSSRHWSENRDRELGHRETSSTWKLFPTLLLFFFRSVRKMQKGKTIIKHQHQQRRQHCVGKRKNLYCVINIIPETDEGKSFAEQTSAHQHDERRIFISKFTFKFPYFRVNGNLLTLTSAK